MTINSILPGISKNRSTVQFGSTDNPSAKFPNGIDPNTPLLKGIQSALNLKQIEKLLRYNPPAQELQQAYWEEVSFSVNQSGNGVTFYFDKTTGFLIDGLPKPSRPGQAEILENVQVDVDLYSGAISSCSSSHTIPQVKALLEKALSPAA